MDSSRSSATLAGPSRTPGDETVRGVVLARFGGAPTGRAIAPTAGGLDEEHVAGADDDADFLGLEHPGLATPRAKSIAMGLTFAAAEQAVRRVASAIAGGVGHRRLLDIHAKS